MILFIALTVVAIAILIAAFRIILGWMLPAPALAKFDRGMSATFGFLAKLSIVFLAGFIVWAIWAFSRS